MADDQVMLSDEDIIRTLANDLTFTLIELNGVQTHYRIHQVAQALQAHYQCEELLNFACGIFCDEQSYQAAKLPVSYGQIRSLVATACFGQEIEFTIEDIVSLAKQQKPFNHQGNLMADDLSLNLTPFD
ncbi:hypothetical protein HR060_09180 [Catenovulum sp. SM1970]|uniref:DUF6559 family protein n=1 Tax=Marinifaba aquimaris TaxID=2741323 RepID=UPI00157316EF|nr:DUF6559 family protein [Marinifaba aquimaris]NTS77044.1 hypothetical protein [Marinifaba aquimaris]